MLLVAKICSTRLGDEIAGISAYVEVRLPGIGKRVRLTRLQMRNCFVRRGDQLCSCLLDPCGVVDSGYTQAVAGVEINETVAKHRQRPTEARVRHFHHHAPRRSFSGWFRKRPERAQ